MSLVKYFIRRLLIFDFICRIFFDRTFHSMPLSYAFKQRRSLNIFPWMVYNFPLLQASNRLHLRWAMVSLFRDPHGTFSTHLNQFKVISELNQTTPPNHREGTWGPGSIACLHSSSSLAIFNGWFELYESVKRQHHGVYYLPFKHSHYCHCFVSCYTLPSSSETKSRFLQRLLLKYHRRSAASCLFHMAQHCPLLEKSHTWYCVRLKGIASLLLTIVQCNVPWFWQNI